MENGPAISQQGGMAQWSVCGSSMRHRSRRMLQEALELEVTEYLAMMAHRRAEDGRREVVRNGHLPERDLITGAGTKKYCY